MTIKGGKRKRTKKHKRRKTRHHKRRKRRKTRHRRGGGRPGISPAGGSMLKEALLQWPFFAEYLLSREKYD